MIALADHHSSTGGTQRYGFTQLLLYRFATILYAQRLSTLPPDALKLVQAARRHTQQATTLLVGCG